MGTKTLYIDHNLIDEDLTDFPVAIDLTDKVPELCNDLGENKYKFKVTLEDGTECYTEIECWETTNKVIHTKIPLVSSTTDTKINLEWDAAWDDNTTYIGETGSDVAKNVWDSNYVAVYHMAQDPSSGTILDSTSNALNGTVYGSMTSEDLIDGILGKAIDFDGVDDYIQTPQTDLMNIGTGDITYLVSYTILSVPGDDHALIRSNWDTPSSNGDIGAGILTYNASSGFNSWAHFRDNSGNIKSSEIINKDLGHHILALTRSTQIGTFFTDLDQSSISDATANYSGYQYTRIANDANGNKDYGTYSEVRISNIARSGAWIKATYYNLTTALIAIAQNHNIKPLYSQIHIKDFISPTKYQLTHIGRRNEVCFCLELQTLYMFTEFGNSYEIDGLKVLQTGQGGDTRWVGIAGKYNYYEQE